MALLLISITGVGVGFYFYNKPLESTESMKADFVISATELLSAFENDENQANTTYLDKVVEVSGQVLKIDFQDGKTTIYLETDSPLSNIIFQLEQPNLEIKEGEKVTLKGICTGYLMDVVVVRAVIV